ncbi:MAG: DNA primase [Bacteroidota bacterium]
MIKNAQQIREAAPILDVVRQYANLELKKSGSNYIACCPFHAEKTPSFSINPAKNIYKCFGCGVGGDAVSFLMENNGMTYPEALQAAAQVAKIEVEYENDANWQERKAEIEEERKEKDGLWAYLKSVHDVLEQYTHRHLSGVYDQINIFGRGYSLATLRTFQISIAPSRAEFNEIAIAHSWDTYLLKQLGLFTDSENPRFIFAERMLFPIFTHLGKVTGLAGRKAPEDDNPKNPKYLNSKESLIFNKSELLYGLHQAKRAIRKEDHAILVEGYTDVMTLYDYGVQNVVASCGTAFTDQQAKLLKRFTKRVILLRDGDEAGVKAAKRDLEILLENGFEVKIILLSEGEDPDSFVRKYGIEEEYKGLRSLELLDAVIWRIMLDFDKHDVYKLENTKDLAANLLARIDNENIRNSYLKKLCKANLLGSVKTELQERIQDHRSRKYEDKREFSEDQKTDIQRYGLFVEKNKYFACSGKREDSFSITNFYIKPIMLVIGTQNSYRLIEIINERNERFITDVSSDDFSEMNAFKKVIEARGNYTFLEYAKSTHYIKIKRRVFDQMQRCYQILTLGWQREDFFAWANGITDAEGKFYESDEYGVV